MNEFFWGGNKTVSFGQPPRQRFRSTTLETAMTEQGYEVVLSGMESNLQCI